MTIVNSGAEPYQANNLFTRLFSSLLKYEVREDGQYAPQYNDQGSSAVVECVDNIIPCLLKGLQAFDFSSDEDSSTLIKSEFLIIQCNLVEALYWLRCNLD